MANAEIWEQRVAGWRASGLTAAAYCAREGLGARALRQWTRRLRREPATPTVRLARVVATPAAVSTAPLVIEVGGARVTVGHDADLGAVLAVVALLGGAR